MRVLLAALCALALLGAVLGQCSGFTDCMTCTASSACGWCGATSTCMFGSASGSSARNCPNAWSWRLSDCLDNCRLRSVNCSTCRSVPGCGYCVGTATCMAGSPSGAVGGCPVGNWAYSASSCPACSIYSTCGSCTAISGCGWCDNRCVSSSQNGPTDPSTMCGYWTYYNTYCSISPTGFYGLTVGIPVGIVALIFLFAICRVYARRTGSKCCPSSAGPARTQAAFALRPLPGDFGGRGAEYGGGGPGRSLSVVRVTQPQPQATLPSVAPGRSAVDYSAVPSPAGSPYGGPAYGQPPVTSQSYYAAVPPAYGPATYALPPGAFPPATYSPYGAPPQPLWAGVGAYGVPGGPAAPSPGVATVAAAPSGVEHSGTPGAATAAVPSPAPAPPATGSSDYQPH